MVNSRSIRRSQLAAVHGNPVFTIYDSLLFHRDAAPKGNAILDLGCSFFWVGVIPGRVGVSVAIYHDIVITRLAFPGAMRMGCAWL